MPRDPREISDDDLWIMLLCALRYSMGRSSYITGLAADLYRRYRHRLTKPQREQVAREIEEELRLAESLSRTLGDKVDHDIWARLAAEIREQEGKHEPA